MFTIDGHAHACGTYRSCDSLEAYLIRHGIDRVVLCGGEPGSRRNYHYPMLSKLFTGEQLGYVLNQIICKVTKASRSAQHIDQQNYVVWQMAQQLPDRVINAYWANPQEADCMEKLISFYENHGFSLIKLHQCWTYFDIGNGHCAELFQWAEANDRPIFIHLLSQQQVRRFADVANQYRRNVFIVAHMIGVNHLSSHLTSPNVYFDLSAPQLYSMKMLKTALCRFGAGRLILGSDTPYGLDNIDRVKARLRRLNLTERDLALIMGENLLHILPASGSTE